jgi:hypothetical protein
LYSEKGIKSGKHPQAAIVLTFHYLKYTHKMKEIINRINDRVKKAPFFDFSILKFEKDNLIIAGSEDLTYYHEVEIEFISVYTVICNTAFKADTSRNVIEIIEDSDEAKEINLKYGVVQGNNVFKLYSEDSEFFYIVLLKRLNLEKKL